MLCQSYRLHQLGDTNNSDKRTVASPVMIMSRNASFWCGAIFESGCSNTYVHPSMERRMDTLLIDNEQRL